MIMLYEMPEMEQWGSSCGDNCMDALTRISKLKDVHVKFSHCPYYFPEDAEVQFVDNGEFAKGKKEICLGIIKRMDWEALEC